MLSLREQSSHSFFIDVYWDEEFLSSVDKKLFYRELNALTSFSSRREFDEAYAHIENKIGKRMVLRLLARKGYLEPELCEKLQEKGLSTQAIQGALAFVRDGKFVDDAEELRRRAERELRKGRGSKVLLFKLKQKGVEPEQLSQLSSEMRPQEKEALQNFLKRRRIIPHQLTRAERHKLYAQLVRRGFSSDTLSTLFAHHDDQDA